MKSEKRLKGEVMYTSVEAARLLGVTPRTIQLWADSGILEARKTSGGHRRFAESVLEAFMRKLDTDEQGSKKQDSDSDTGKSVYRILIAEDEPDLRTLYQMTMEEWDLPIELVMVKDGYDALIRIGTDRPDMLIADLNMPKMDGFYMLFTIMGSESSKNLEVLAVTALTAKDIEQHGGLPAGVKVMHKPIPFDKLKQLISEQCEAKLQR